MKTLINNAKFRIYYLSVFKVKTFIRRTASRVFKFNRPSSYPFITGDSFRSLADHVYDELQDVRTDEVTTGDIVFVRGDFLHTFFKKIHPKIKNKYILISHNSDENINQDFAKYIDEKIIHWFAQNLMITHEKCTPIPIGIQLRMYDVQNKIPAALRMYRKNTEKADDIFYAFSEDTNPNRLVALDSLSKSAVAIQPQKKLTREEYYAEVSKHAFNASPEGNGVDCNRTWETLYLNAIPVLERSVNSEYWEKIGLPVLLIDSWKDLDLLDRDTLKDKAAKLRADANTSPLYMDYWIKEIYNKKNEY